jgi:hypothetical protein
MPTAVEHGSVGREPGGNATLQSESRYTSDSDWRTASWLLTFQHDGSVNRQAVALVVADLHVRQCLGTMRYRGLGSVGPPLWSLYCLIGNAYKPDTVHMSEMVVPSSHIVGWRWAYRRQSLVLLSCH